MFDTPTVPQSNPNNVASCLISREINHLKDEINLMKADIAAALHGRRQAAISNPDMAVGRELMAMKKELSSLRETISSNHSKTYDFSCQVISPPHLIFEVP